MYLVQGSYENAISYCRGITRNAGFEFCFTYVSENEVFKEINRFIWESKHMHTRFKNKYKGSVVVDISQWCDKEPNLYFDAFMYYLKDNSTDYKIDFIADKECPKSLVEYLQTFFELDVIDLGIKKVKEKTKIGFRIGTEEKEYV